MANFIIRNQDGWDTDKCPICKNRTTEGNIKELVINYSSTSSVAKMCNSCMRELRNLLDENIEVEECTTCGGFVI